MLKKLRMQIPLLVMVLFMSRSVLAGDEIASLKIQLDTIWVLLAGFLVFFMNTGFGMLESGLARSKNTVNIISKNFIVFAIATFCFLFLGWGLMFGDGNGFVGYKGLIFMSGVDNSPAVGDAYQGVYSAINWTAVPLNAKFFFQLVFAATAATIVSGAVAERIKYSSFIIFSALLTVFVYPVVGHWIWGGGFLSALGFHDFAGSTVVHSVGGWAALAGILVLGPRIDKYDKKGRMHPLPGHNMTSAFIGCFILWFGWFGFNAGSTMAANADAIAHIALITNLAAAMGTMTATATYWVLVKKPDITMTLNGCLAGLVAITAPCAVVTVTGALIIGSVAGVLVVFAIIFWDKAKIDDPVGATSVHLVCGVFGTLSVALFGDAATAKNIAGLDALPGIGVQLAGVVSAGGYAFIVSYIFWYALKRILGIRVGAEEERRGLDLSEHGAEAYPDFQSATHFS